MLDGIGGALIAGIVALVTWLATTANARSLRATDRRDAIKDKEDALARQKLDLLESWDHERDVQQREDGRAAARDLLVPLRQLRDDFTRDVTDNYEGHNVDNERRNAVEDAALVIPDGQLREYVQLSMNVICGSWLLARMGEFEGDSVRGAQWETLRDLMRHVGTYAATNEWNTDPLAGMRSISGDVDRAYDEWEKDRQRMLRVTREQARASHE